MQEAARNTVITSDVNAVLGRITGEESFIAIGELHNSHSALKFIKENMGRLVSGERKTYFLTEFLKEGAWVTSEAEVAKQFDHRTFCQDRGLHKDRSLDLGNIYDALIGMGVQLVSIEDNASRVPNSPVAQGVKDGNLEALKIRTDALNDRAISIAEEIWGADPSARILVFAGMNHVVNSKFKTMEDSQFVGEITTRGIAERLREVGGVCREGFSINIHEPELCDDEILKNFSCQATCYTKAAKADKYVTVDSPDMLLFLNAQKASDVNDKNRDSFESIFFVGECDNVTDMQDTERRRAHLSNLNALAAKVAPLPSQKEIGGQAFLSPSKKTKTDTVAPNIASAQGSSISTTKKI